jgi:nitrite reductase (NADH) large subunit
MSEPLVIVGNGMAAASLADELARRALGRYAIAIIGSEPRLAYNRVLLSSVLAGEAQTSDIELKPAGWWRDRGFTLRYGCAAAKIDPQARAVSLEDGHELAFSKLVIATGSQAIKLPIPGIGLANVFTFRDVGDVETIAAATGAHTRVVVIGGGLLGLEAAHGLAKAGAKVTLVHLMDRLMERQLDERAAAMLRRAVEAKGIRVLLQAETAEIAGAHQAEVVVLKDGREIPTDAVVMAAGIKPNVELARSAGLDVGRGIKVDDVLATSAPGIYAIGECAEHHGVCYGLVEPAYEQARVLADHLCGGTNCYRGSVQATNLKVSGVSVFSAGDFVGAHGTEQIVLCDPGVGIYKKLVIAEDRLVGAVLFGDTADGPWYLDFIRCGGSIEYLRNELMFGRALLERQAA